MAERVLVEGAAGSDRTLPTREVRSTEVAARVAPAAPAASWLDRILAWRDVTVASAGFQKWAARFPLTRPIALRRSRALFDVMAGFVYSQVLRACVELDMFALLAKEPQPIKALARHVDVPADALERLVRAAVALKLLEWRSGDRVGLGMLGAPLANNEALRALVDHHALLYEDLRNPVELLRSHSDTDTALGRYYPYATEGAAPPAKAVASYSALMSATAAPLIAEVLDAYSFASRRRVLDVGGGEGRFARALSARWPDLDVAMYDLPSVADRAREENARLDSKVNVIGGDFRQDTIPGKWDVITLVRILLDHGDDTVRELLRQIHGALAPGGELVIAEPMAGVRGAQTVGDAYFGFYLLAMGNGRARRQGELEALCLDAGFRRCRTLGTRYPVSTGILVAER